MHDIKLGGLHCIGRAQLCDENLKEKQSDYLAHYF